MKPRTQSGVERAVAEARALWERLREEGIAEREIVAGFTLALARIPALRALAAEPRIAAATVSGIEIGKAIAGVVKALR